MRTTKTFAELQEIIDLENLSVQLDLLENGKAEYYYFHEKSDTWNTLATEIKVLGDFTKNNYSVCTILPSDFSGEF